MGKKGERGQATEPTACISQLHFTIVSDVLFILFCGPLQLSYTKKVPAQSRSRQHLKRTRTEGKASSWKILWQILEMYNMDGAIY